MSRWQGRLNTGRCLLAGVLLAGGLAASATAPTAAEDSFTGWRGAAGDGQIEYRWRNYTGNYRLAGCHVEFRSLDGNDRHTYVAKMDTFDSYNKDHTERARITFYDKGDIKTADDEPCDRVTGVLMEVQPED